MKRYFLLLSMSLTLLTSCILTSCKKQSQNPDATAELKQIATKYNLKLVKIDTNSVNNTKYHFTDVKSFERFLSIHIKRIKDSVNSVTVIKSFNRSLNDNVKPATNSSLEASPNSGASSETSDVVSSAIGPPLELKFNFPDFASQLFPSVVNLNWIAGQGTVQSQLIYNGINYGTWSYNQTIGLSTGGVSQGTLSIQGNYAEFIPIMGYMYTYTWLFKMTVQYGVSGAGYLVGNAHAEYDPKTN